MRGEYIRWFLSAQQANQGLAAQGGPADARLHVPAEPTCPVEVRQLSTLADDGNPLFSEDVNDDHGASLCPAIAELERAFRAFCDLSFKRQMPLPVITIQTRGRSSVLGWFSKEKWKNGQAFKLPEINICPEYLCKDVEQIAQVLLHEMCHYANYLDGVQDCSSSQYHNRRFKYRCESIGLVCSKGRKGFAYTRLSPELAAVVRRVLLNPAAFRMYRDGPQYQLVEVNSGPERRLRRWKCQCKKSKVIYASRGLDVTCNLCGRRYEDRPLHGEQAGGAGNHGLSAGPITPGERYVQPLALRRLHRRVVLDRARDSAAARTSVIATAHRLIRNLVPVSLRSNRRCPAVRCGGRLDARR